MSESASPYFKLVAEAAVKCSPQVTKTIMRGVSHMMNVEDPDAFNQALLAFLADVDSGF